MGRWGAGVVIVAAACTSSPAPEGSQGYVGYVVQTESSTWACANLLESNPPQCVTPSDGGVDLDSEAIVVDDWLDVRALPTAQSLEGVVWTDLLALRGHVAGSVFVVDDVDLEADCTPTGLPRPTC